MSDGQMVAIWIGVTLLVVLLGGFFKKEIADEQGDVADAIVAIACFWPVFLIVCLIAGPFIGLFFLGKRLRRGVRP